MLWRFFMQLIGSVGGAARRRADGPAAARSRASRPATDFPYAAVTVTTTTVYCQAARDTQAHPILRDDQPSLPLPDCSMPEKCVCRFRRWPDRRIGERRLPDDVTISTRTLNILPRSGRGRRKDDR